MYVVTFIVYIICACVSELVWKLVIVYILDENETVFQRENERELEGMYIHDY